MVWTVIAAFGGAFATGMAAWLAGVLNIRRRAARRVKKGAFRCYLRLMKIAESDEYREGEFKYLGYDLDVWRDAIGDRPRGWKAHEDAWKRVIPILMRHDMTHIQVVADELRALWNGK